MKNKWILYGPLAVIAVWFIASKVISNYLLFPGPFETIYEVFRLLLSGEILGDLYSTLYRIFLVLILSIIIGVPLGLFLGSNEKIYRSLEFLIDFFRSTPSTAIFPAFLLFFGISDFSKIASATFGALLIIIFNTAYGVFNSKKTRVLALKMMGASTSQIFRKVVIWESLPQTFVGLRSAVSLTLVILVVLEMFIGTVSGLGRKIIDFQIIYNSKAMYATIIIVGVVGYLLNYLIYILEKKVVHWNKQ
jgi:NitT/TauT family transport system permease protein